VLSTDYIGHSLVFGCSEYGPFHAEFAWILSREPTMDSETLTELQSILAAARVNTNKLRATLQGEACRAMEE